MRPRTLKLQLKKKTKLIKNTHKATAMRIRPATAADLSNILKLIHLKAEFDGCPEAVEATSEALNATLFAANPMAYILLAESKTQSTTPVAATHSLPVGFASYHFTYSTFLAQPSLWLDDIFIKETHRNCGLGAELIRTLCQIALKHNCGRVDWTVDKQNQAGIRFYQRIGGQLQTQVHLCRLNRSAIDKMAISTVPAHHARQ